MADDYFDLDLLTRLDKTETDDWRPRESEDSKCTKCVRIRQRCVWYYEDESCYRCRQQGRQDACVALRQRQYRKSKPYVPRGRPRDHAGANITMTHSSIPREAQIDVRPQKKVKTNTPLQRKRKASELDTPEHVSHISVASSTSNDLDVLGSDAELEEEFEVERILDGICSQDQADLLARIGRGHRVEYLVKWFGYDQPGDDTVSLPIHRILLIASGSPQPLCCKGWFCPNVIC